MAARPVFVPKYEGVHLVIERSFEIRWASGFSETQKKKNVASLHAAARADGLEDILEISSKSEDEVGRRLSAFSLKIDISGQRYSLESIYQSAKFFSDSGSFPEVAYMSPKEAKRFVRANQLGHLVRFQLGEKIFPTSPPSAFYDWMYIRSLAMHENWIANNISYSAYTDIEFNPAKQVNCQARAFAEYMSLLRRGQLKRAADDFEYFAGLLSPV